MKYHGPIRRLLFIDLSKRRTFKYVYFNFLNTIVKARPFHKIKYFVYVFLFALNYTY